MGRTLNRVAGVVSAAVLATFVAAPVALAQETDTTAPESPTTTATSETTTTTAPSTSETTTPVTTTETTSADPTTGVTTTKPPKTTTTTSDESEPPADDYQDNTGAGVVGVGGEGSLTINCAAGAPGNVATQYLDVTGGPDQDGADGRIWHYSVRVAQLPPGTTTGKFSWTCAGVDGEGVVTFEQAPPPETSTTNPPTTTSVPTTTSTPASTTSVPSSTAPVTTAPVTTATSAAAGNAAPKAQVKVTPKGGIETGFGGTAR
ncbi:hypothetical protein [Amycolatopsis sp. RTGN1]|uniref:hypothetical protein n=1 Tax=Amycolatopsis ponsaeliensis TaxID=2992142 RepID=UPI0025507828|nr:hypothetical protein [Amycolatopsis sp. RTGN1]